MNRKVFITIIFFIILIIIFSSIFLIFNYKTLKSGNNTISIKNIENVSEYILNINEYNAEVEVTVKSNKNENKYNIKQRCKNNYSYQETEYENNELMIIEHIDNKVIIKNNKLKLEKIYESCDFLLENNLFLTTFIEEYKNTNQKEIIENENYYIIKIKLNDISNKKVAYKNLYINKNIGKIEKLEINHINKNRTIYILYKEITIN